MTKKHLQDLYKRDVVQDLLASEWPTDAQLAQIEEDELHMAEFEDLTEENGYVDFPDNVRPTRKQLAESMFDPEVAKHVLDMYEADLNNREANLTDFIVPDEMQDFKKVMAFGISKGYEPDSWLLKNGAKTSSKDMHDSMFHHLAESFAGQTKDKESGLDPLLHLACRALMLYTRRQNGIINDRDLPNEGV
jgi:hypothetical protein